jgi:hypothetical protein
MSEQRYVNLGILEEKKQHEQVLRIKVNGLREQLAKLVNPYKPLADLAGDEIVVHAQELAANHDKWHRLCKEIRALCDELGEPVPSFE